MTNNIKSNFKINETIWSSDQIEQLAYQRNLHMLHSFLRHNVQIKRNNQLLTDNDIDFLTSKEAWEVSIDTREKYTNQAMIDLYENDFKKSNQMWHDLKFNLNNPMKVSRCNMKVEGLSLTEFMGIMKKMQTDEKYLLSIHPEHFKGTVTDDDILSVEPFGMYGTPTLVKVKILPEDRLNQNILIDKDGTYNLSMSGEAFLTDNTPVNVPYHQFKSTENGFEAKLAVYWPENVPEEIVKGHELHLATEFYYALKIFEKN